MRIQIDDAQPASNLDLIPIFLTPIFSDLLACFSPPNVPRSRGWWRDFLVGCPVAPSLAAWLSSTFGVDARAIRDLGLREAEDREIFQAARVHGDTVIVSKDSDFVDLVMRLETPPQVLWVTCGNLTNRRLQEVFRAIADQGRFHPLASPAVEEIAEGMEVKSAKAWRERLARLAEARTLQQPEPPSTHNFYRPPKDSRKNGDRNTKDRSQDVERRQAAKAVLSNHKRWKLSNTFAVNKAYPVGWFIAEMGQAIRSNKQLPHWFDVDRWIRLTLLLYGEGGIPGCALASVPGCLRGSYRRHAVEGDEPKLRFTSLAHHITGERVWGNLNRIPNRSAPGVDGQTVAEAKEDFGVWIEPMLEAAHRQGYPVSPIRRVYASIWTLTAATAGPRAT